MAGLADVRGGKQHRVMFVVPDGREYWLTLISMGAFYDEPPLVVFERDDGFLEVPSTGAVYSSLDDLAVRHGCMLGDLVSIEPTN